MDGGGADEQSQNKPNHDEVLTYITEQATEQTTINTEFTECVETNFQREKPFESSGKSPENDVSKSNNVVKVQQDNVTHEATLNTDRETTVNTGATQASQNTLKNWKANVLFCYIIAL